MEYKELLKSIKNKIKPLRAIITPEPVFQPAPGLENGKNLLMVVDDNFNQTRPHSITMTVNGFCRGWAKAVGKTTIIEVRNLMSEINKYDNPAVFLPYYYLSKLSLNDCRKLRKADCFTWISIHPRKINKFEKNFLGASSGADTNIWLENYSKVMMLEPKFVWNAFGKDGSEWYQGWIDDGLKWETLHLAADDSLYYHDFNKEYKDAEIGYVGGYWPEKAQAFDKYLRPFEDKLWVYGYATWPYKNYKGKMDFNEERRLYSSAKIIPLITSPGGWMLAEITERYFKAPACQAFCIADENPALREIFTEEEMLQAKSAEHFQEIVNNALNGKIDLNEWSKNSYNAVIKKHLYSHRALQIKNLLS